MFARAIGLSATLALAANAVLLPPGVALKEHHGKHGKHEMALDVHENGAVVPLPCYGCPFSKVEGDGMIWSADHVENSLVYEFGLGSEHDRLTLNGVQLYPPSFNEPEPIYISQVPAGVQHPKKFLAAHPKRKALRVTGMEFAFNSAETISDEGNELLTMHLKIFGLADMPLPPQVLRIFVIKDSEGRLRLAQITKLNNPHEIEAEEEEQCKSWPMVCKWRKVFADKLSGFGVGAGRPQKGCNKSRPAGAHGAPGAHGTQVDNRPHHHHPWGKPFGGKPHPNGRPGHQRPPHGAHAHGWHHHHHSKVHRFLHMVTRVMANIVIPILIGIAAGVVTYMAGMLLGMTAAFVWIKIRGGRRGQYNAVPQDEEESSDHMPKSGKEIYLDEEVAEEIREAPPVYEEVVEKEVAN